MLESVQRPLYRGNELKEPRGRTSLSARYIPDKVSRSVHCHCRCRAESHRCKLFTTLLFSSECARARAYTHTHTETAFRSHVDEAYGWSTNTSTRGGTHRSSRHGSAIRGKFAEAWCSLDREQFHHAQIHRDPPPPLTLFSRRF